MDKKGQLIPQDDLNMSTSTLGAEYDLGTGGKNDISAIGGVSPLRMEYHSKPLDCAPTLDEPLKVTIVGRPYLDARPGDDIL
jgi:hypothetical protein